MLRLKPYHALRLLLACIFTWLFSPVWSQLKADFTIDKPGGCAPHAVSFTNTSTGTSGTTTYTWTFGNGNTSALKNPGATYNEEKVYSVTLTAKDGTQTSTKTLQVTVYKKPEVNFTANVLKGCAPMPVELTSTSTAGDGSIATYFWDFGDGGLQQGATLQKVAHTYQNAQKASISLTVTNSYGCFRTFEKTALVDIAPPITAAFSVASSLVCEENAPVSFTNTSTGPGTLNYTWDFGDGAASTSVSPTHTYNKKGKFEVKLLVKNELGCTAASAPLTLSVADFITDFTVPALVCNAASFLIQNKSIPAPTDVSWTSDDGSTAWSYGNTPVNFVFSQPGKRKLTMRARYGDCYQSVTKEVDVKTGPDLNGFVVDLGSSCGAPQTVKMKDTTSAAIKWSWAVDFAAPFASTREASYLFQTDRSYTVSLKVENAAGCVSATSQYINIYKPVVSISLLSGAASGCINLKNKFGTYQSEEIESYQWDFGDGGTSKDAEPEHVFAKEGVFTVKLNYTTKSGCKGIATSTVNINRRPVADFKTDPTVICGNTPHRFTNLTTGYTTGFRWDFFDFQPTTFVGNDAIHQFQEAGKYTVQLIAYNGNCLDTITKTDYVEVKPGFPDISYATNTCEDTRGEVRVYQMSREVETYTWDFGDGTTPVRWTAGQESIFHTYTRSGSYKVKLTITNGNCTVSDSLDVPVLLKQQPVLSSVTTELCSSASLDIKISGMENNPRPVSWYYGTHYMVNGLLYQDGSRYEGFIDQVNNYWTTTYNGRYQALDPSKKGIRAVLQSQYFGCYDTTNLLPLLIKGPIADFKAGEAFYCFRDSAKFIDQSVGQNNVPIVKWEWSFGDNSTLQKNNSATVAHLYQEPQQYYATLKVTDAEGCYHATGDYLKPVNIYGPKAGFDFSPARVIPQTTVNFYSTSNAYPYNPVDYRWRFQDGTNATGYYAGKYYPAVTNDTVRLIARDLVTGCRDTAYKVVAVKDVAAGFTYTTSYINTTNCPPVVASFTNTSDNYQSIRWDFGNGRSAGNLNNVSSTYELPGIYTVTIYAYGFNNSVDSLKLPIEIKGPYAILSADTLFGCQDLTVQLNAVVRNASSFTWDFGDGTLLQTTDTFAVHKYLSPGIYQPALIMKDASGCAGTSKIDDKIIIDQLLTNASAVPSLVCDSGLVQFNPVITSLAASELGLPLSYSWESGNGQFSAADQPSFYYNQPGKYTSRVAVVSPFGCTAESSVSLELVRTTRASIQGPPEICANGEALFTGSADRNGNLNWNWDFGGSGTADQQNPAAIRFSQPGSYPVQLIVAHNGCRDTAVAQLVVHPNPEVGLSPRDPVICLGNSIRLTAHDGVQFNWRAADGIATLNSPNPFVAPQYTTTYQVAVTNSFGCVSLDSTKVTVGRPFTIRAAEDTSVCRGFSVTLPVTGAATYNWISGAGLSSTTSSSPVASPLTDTRYIVVGYDEYGCFTDTAALTVVVRELPAVQAGQDIQLATGERIELKPVYSSDVVTYNWSPQWYLSCTTCPNPFAAPKDNYTYTVTVKNQYGCMATDDIAIKLVCA
ncbi:PKD domain-containing protein, partial [Flavihumibacter sp. CACIAM 22H1]|uniref:PKD domain-containing protein n=1 Tax=Flavihumibacter sp. CACIAM 22H1 TaxID=1812911 RepID=UPI0025BECADA